MPLSVFGSCWGICKVNIVLPGGVQFFEESPVVRTPLSFGLGWFPILGYLTFYRLSAVNFRSNN